MRVISVQNASFCDRINVFLQVGDDGDPVLGPDRPPFLAGACYDGRRLQVSASGAA